MIEIASSCGHHKSGLNVVLMLVLARNISSDLAIVCPTCRKVLFRVSGFSEVGVSRKLKRVK
jgi:predicted HNH restriction endonuclease